MAKFFLVLFLTSWLQHIFPQPTKLTDNVEIWFWHEDCAKSLIWIGNIFLGLEKLSVEMSMEDRGGLQKPREIETNWFNTFPTMESDNGAVREGDVEFCFLGSITMFYHFSIMVTIHNLTF